MKQNPYTTTYTHKTYYKNTHQSIRYFLTLVKKKKGYRRRRSRPRNSTPPRPNSPILINSPHRAARRNRHRNQLAQLRSHPRRHLLRRAKPQSAPLHPRQRAALRPRGGAGHSAPPHGQVDSCAECGPAGNPRQDLRRGQGGAGRADELGLEGAA